MNEYKRIPYDRLMDFCIRLFTSYGFTKDDASKISDVLLTADLFGIESHGISRISKYIKPLNAERIKLDFKPEIIKETPVSAVIDAHSGMGQLAGIMAMELAIKKAKTSGMSIVTVKGSNHFGIAGYYSLMAAKNGLIGISMTNSPSIMVPTFSKEAILGSNPISFAIPTGERPFLFDAATTVTTRGKLELFNKLGKSIEYDWAVNDSGNISNDPAEVLDCIAQKKGGGILPLGGAGENTSGYKGFGFAMICSIFCSVLSNGVLDYEITANGDTGHCFIVIDHGILGDKDVIEANLLKLIDHIHNSDKVDDTEQIFIAGEKEFNSAEEGKRNGVNVSMQTLNELSELALQRNIDFI